MATIYSETSDGYQNNTIVGGPTWAAVRGNSSTSGTASGHAQTYNNFAIHSTHSPKGGGLFACWRSYFEFDLRSESGTVDKASLFLYARRFTTGAAGDYAKVIAVQATALAESTSDFGNVFTDTASPPTIGTTMSAAVEITGTSFAYHEIEITGDTSTGGVEIINDAVGTSGSGGFVTIGVMAHYYDYLNNTPDGVNATNLSCYFSDYTGTSRDPYLDITYETTAVTDNATFFGTNF